MKATVALGRGLVAAILVASTVASTVAASTAKADTATTPQAAASAKPPIGHDEAFYTFGVGTFAPHYAPPDPGTYALPPIQTVKDHALVDAFGQPTTLARVLDGRLAVVSFIYGSCAEATGCPMSTAVLHRLDAELAGEPAFRREVVLVTVSFDPKRDTPTRLGEMQKGRAVGSNWQFVTTTDEITLAPLLDDFGQTVSSLRYPDGAWTGVYRHVLKVYLLDRDRRVRNIYGVGFLDPRVVASDLKTLQLESPSGSLPGK